MIRIEEIYVNIFKNYIDKNIPKTRLFFCDPPGTTDPENLMNYGHDITEYNYIFLHDQEPIFLDVHKPLFDDVEKRNKDITDNFNSNKKILIHSEKNSDEVNEVCNIYGWDDYYYFFHGWAALEWFRGFNYDFTIEPPESRKIKSSFISPNRIIGGKRNHRVLLFYNMVKNNITNAKISMPQVCPYENEFASKIGRRYRNTYPDIEKVLGSVNLPWNFSGEENHPMESYTLGLFDQSFESLAYIVTETVFSGKRNHLTEKIFKPICMYMPFILVSTAYSLEYLKSYGFKTFSEFWSEDYDTEEDDILRIEKIAKLTKNLDDLTPKELNQMYKHMIPTLKFNYNHFYNGVFKNILWKELTSMLNNIKKDINS